MLETGQSDRQGAESKASGGEGLAAMHRACSIAIVGGGISGLSCAHKLLQLLPNARINVIDMGRSGPGESHHQRRMPVTLQPNRIQRLLFMLSIIDNSFA
jgi:NAD(P)-binding Rossmann-like domain